MAKMADMYGPILKKKITFLGCLSWISKFLIATSIIGYDSKYVVRQAIHIY